MQRKTLLYLFLGISAFTAAYLHYVHLDRKQSIERYFNDPKVGDVYKIKKNDSEGDHGLVYYKLAEISPNNLVFYPGKMSTGSSIDYLQNHYETNYPVIFSRKDLTNIKEGKWNNFLKDNTVLVEIVRRK